MSKLGVLVFAVLPLLMPSVVTAGPRRSELGEEIPDERSVARYLDDRVICHTFVSVLNLPENDDTVELSRFDVASPFASFLAEAGIVGARRLFPWRSVRAVKESRASDVSGFIDLDNSYVLYLPPDMDVTTAIYRISQNCQVMFVEPDYILDFPSYSDPSKDYDPLWDNQWNLMDPNETSSFGIGCDTAWYEIGYGDSAVRVGVMDHGIDSYHPDFNLAGTSCVVDGLYLIPPDIIHPTGVWTDDIFYWSHDSSHGNAVAGIFGARSWNGVGIHGVAGGNGDDAFGVSLVSLRLSIGSIATAEFAQYSPSIRQ